MISYKNQIKLIQLQLNSQQLIQMSHQSSSNIFLNTIFSRIYYYKENYNHPKRKQKYLNMLSVEDIRRSNLPTHRANLIFGISILIFELLILFMYGFFINFVYQGEAIFDGHGPFLVFALALMTLVGFGLLLTYIQTASWTALTFNLLITAVTIQFYFLVNAFFTKIQLQPSNETMNSQGFREMELTPYLSNYGGSFSDAFRCCISMSVVYSVLHGRIGMLETFVCTIVGNIAYEVNRQLLEKINCIDNGGSMTIFAFGATFGLAIAVILDRRHTTILHPKYKSSKQNTLFAFIGMLFLWCLFPILNTTRNLQASEFGTLGQGISNPFASASPINTWIALASSTVSAFCTSIFIHNKISPNDVIFGSFAGAVAFGASSNLIFYPVAPMTTGMVSGIIAVVSLSYLRRWNTTSGILDSNGSVESFLIPGVCGSIWAAIYAAFSGGSYNFSTSEYNYPYFGGNFIQGGLEIAGIFITLGVAVFLGIIVGYFVKWANNYQREDQFDDGTAMTIQDDGLQYRRPLGII